MPPALSKAAAAAGRLRPDNVPEAMLPAEFNIGLVIGGSGTGKSKFLRHYFGEPQQVVWDSNKAVVSQFADPETGKYNTKGAADEGTDRLSSVGLGSIPTWMRPFECLSNGEQARSLLARQIRDGAIIDDFTAVVNRHAAWAMCASISRFIRQRGIKKVVFASSCGDIVQWLQPDWVVVLDGSNKPVHFKSNPVPMHAGANQFRPVVNVTYKLEAIESEMQKQYERTWALKDAEGIKVKKVHKAKTEDGDRKAKLEIDVLLDESTERASEAFDYQFNGKSIFDIPILPTVPQDFSIGLIVGPSGSGKTTLLKKHFSLPLAPVWERGRKLEDYFEGDKDKLQIVGLPEGSWTREYLTLSTGEMFRADLARCLHNGGVVDEFTSNIDRHLAIVVSSKVGVYVKENGIKGLVLATCHDDFVPWLQPDWVYSTQTHELLVLDNTQKPPSLPAQPNMSQLNFEVPMLSIDLRRNKAGNMWPIFREYHYLDRNINPACQFFVAWWKQIPVGCVAVTGNPGAVRQGTAKREHRTVMMPDFQGLGIGTRMSDTVARIIFVHERKFYFSRTAHPRFGKHRQKSDCWVGTGGNLGFLELKGVYGSTARITGEYKDTREKQKFRICFSHMYVGTQEERDLFKKGVEPQVWDCFMTSLTNGMKRDAKGKKESMEELREKTRIKLKKKAAKESQSGRTAFSKGGVAGPNKLECLVAFGNLKLGPAALELEAKGNKFYGGLVFDMKTSANGRILYKDGAYGDMLSFANAVMRDAGASELKTQADCWKRISQGGKTMQALRKEAAVVAIEKRVNPRSIKEWKALADGELDKIRRLGSNAQPLQGAGAEESEEKMGHGGGHEGTEGNRKVRNKRESPVKGGGGGKQPKLDTIWTGRRGEREVGIQELTGQRVEEKSAGDEGISGGGIGVGDGHEEGFVEESQEEEPSSDEDDEDEACVITKYSLEGHALIGKYLMKNFDGELSHAQSRALQVTEKGLT